MDLLKKLKSLAGKTQSEPSFVFRAPRVALTPLHRVELTQKNPERTFRLSNISTSGLGLFTEEQREEWKRGATLAGDLVFNENGGKRVYPTKLKIIHVTRGVLGASFDAAEGDPGGVELRQSIRRYFELEILALGMMKINPEYHKNEADGKSHWIHGDYCDLYYVEREGRVVRFRLTFLGNHFTGGENRSVQAGQMLDDDVTGKILHKSSTVVTNVEPSPELIETALKFLGNIPHLDESHRSAIATLLRPQ